MKLTFNETYEFEGKKYDELDLPLEDLNGAQLRKYQKDYIASKRNAHEKLQAGNLLVTVSGDPEFAVFIAASASKQPIEFFEQLPAKEYISAIAQISAFLLS